jgi:hypothetical protein
MAKTFNKLPSEILNIEDEYVGYCFNEACTYILFQLEDKKTPIFDDDIEHGRKENPGLQMLLK